jgi:hypothetical protein
LGPRGLGPSLHRTPGRPWESAYAASRSTAASETRVIEPAGVFASLTEAKIPFEEYRNHYNHRRPRSALSYPDSGEVRGVECHERERCPWRGGWGGTNVDTRTLIPVLLVAAATENDRVTSQCVRTAFED